MQVAANTLERAMAVPWDQLGPDWAKSVRMPEWAKQLMDDGRVAVEVEPLKGCSGAKLIRVEVSYGSGSIRARRSVELVAVRSAREASVPSRTAAAGGHDRDAGEKQETKK